MVFQSGTADSPTEEQLPQVQSIEDGVAAGILDASVVFRSNRTADQHLCFR